MSAATNDHGHERRSQQQRHEGRAQAGEPGIDGQLGPVAARADEHLHGHQRGQQHDREQVGRPPYDGVRERPLRHRHAGQLEQVAADARSRARPARSRRPPRSVEPHGAHQAHARGRPPTPPAPGRRRVSAARGSARARRPGARPPGCASWSAAATAGRGTRRRRPRPARRRADRPASCRPAPRRAWRGSTARTPTTRWTGSPARACSRVVRVSVIAVDSSITRWAAAARRAAAPVDASGRPSGRRACCGCPAAAPTGRRTAGLPPEPITPTRANCEAPVNTSSESAHDCQTSSPLATEIAPKEMP